jgi:hypothetical protein
MPCVGGGDPPDPESRRFESVRDFSPTKSRAWLKPVVPSSRKPPSPMGDEDVGKKHSDQISKQKEALAKARSLVNRPEAAKKLSTSPSLEPDYASPPKFVTYPEFEPVTNSKTPLLTLRRLVLLLYLSAGTATTIYAISKVFDLPIFY